MLEAFTALTTAAGTALGLIKGATDIGKDIKALLDRPEVDTAAARGLVLELQGRLIDIQAAQIAMQSALLEAREEQRRINRFTTQAQRYALTRSAMGALVYELKPDQANGEPPHCICATCYDKQIKSILQPVERNKLGCGVCGGQFSFPDGRIRDAMDGGLRVGYDIINPYGD